MAAPRLRPAVLPMRLLGPPTPHEPPRGWVLVVLAALAGLAGGYLIGVGGVAGPVIPPIEELPAPTLVEPVNAVEEEPPPAPEPAEPGGPSLATRVPGFRHTLRITGIDLSGGGPPLLVAVSWDPGDAAPVAAEADLGTAVASLDRSGRWLAARQDSTTLFAGDLAEVSRLMDGVHSFAWSASTPGDLAWIEQLRPDVLPTLHTGTVAADGVYFRPVVSLDHFEYAYDRGRWEGPQLVHFDGSGFVLQSTARPVGPRLVTLDAVGEEVGASDGVFLGAGPAGEVAMFVERTHTLRIADRSLRGVHGLALAPLGRVVWSHDGTQIAMIIAGGNDDGLVELAIWSESTPLRTIDLGAYWAEVEAWSPDDRFVVLTGGRRAGRQVLLIVDLDTAIVHPVQVGLTVQQVVVADPVGAAALPGSAVAN